MPEDKYTKHLTDLCELKPGELLEVNEIGNPKRQWAAELLKAISPPPPLRPTKRMPKQGYKRQETREDKAKADGQIPEEYREGRKSDEWPRYTLKKVLKKGGQCLALLGTDKKRRD